MKIKRTIKLPQDRFFTQTIATVIETGRYAFLKNWVQHAGVSTYRHSLWVTALTYRLARKLKLKVDYCSLIRGSLLHDYYLYDWHDKHKGLRGHGFKHPAISYKRASEDYMLNEIEKDMIVKHMFPLTPFPPKYKESFCLSLCDKIVSLLEIFRLVKDE
ncbi:MAG: phosphohydrolase [Clostridia bacterium]|nr:phosphohydrolase [Clostridia bacterium]